MQWITGTVGSYYSHSSSVSICDIFFCFQESVTIYEQSCTAKYLSVILNSIDHENGGYFTCLDGDGNLYDDTKFMWLNGRQVYMFAKMYCECGEYSDGATRESWIRDNS